MATSVCWFIRNWSSKQDWRVVGPFGVLLLCYLYYCSIGPLLMNWFSDMQLLNISNYDSIQSSSYCSLVSFFFSCLGYWRYKRPKGQVFWSDNRVDFTWKRSLAIYFIFYVFFLISKKFNIHAVYNIAGAIGIPYLDARISSSGFENYLMLLMSSMILPLLMLWSASGRSLFRRVISIILTLNLLTMILATGFRLRLIFLLLCAVSLMVLKGRSRQDWFLGYRNLVRSRVIMISAILVALITLMSLGRVYGKGIDFEKLRFALEQGGHAALAPFKDSNIFFVGGSTKDYVDANSSYVFFEPLKMTFVRMIPSGMYGEKPRSETLYVIGETMGGQDAMRLGFAVPFYIEHYISFGWWGLIIGSYVLGFLCRWVENLTIRKKLKSTNLFFIAASGYVFIYFHRGHLPQQVEYFMFMVMIPWALLLPYRITVK